MKKRVALGVLVALGIVPPSTSYDSQPTPLDLPAQYAAELPVTHIRFSDEELLAKINYFEKSTASELEDFDNPYQFRHTLEAMQAMLLYYEKYPEKITREVGDTNKVITFGGEEEPVRGWLHLNEHEHMLGMQFSFERMGELPSYLGKSFTRKETLSAKLYLFNPHLGEVSRLPRYELVRRGHALNDIRYEQLLKCREGIFCEREFGAERAWRELSHTLYAYYGQTDMPWKPEEYVCCTATPQKAFWGNGYGGEEQFIKALRSGERDFSNALLRNLDLRPYANEFNEAYDGKTRLNFHGATLEVIFPQCRMPGVDLIHAYVRKTDFTLVDMPGAKIDSGVKLIGQDSDMKD